VKRRLEIVQDCKVCGGNGINPDKHTICSGCYGKGEIKSVIFVKQYKDLDVEESKKRTDEMVKLYVEDTLNRNNPLTEGNQRHDKKPVQSDKKPIIKPPGVTVKTMATTYEPDPIASEGDM